jgi:membrane protease YdiL (CAAX protease family)
VLDSGPVQDVHPENAGEPAPSLDAPRRVLPIERLGAFIETVLCSGFPTQLLVFGTLTGMGMRPRAPDGGWASSFIIAMSLIDMLLVIGLVCLFLRAHGEPLREFVVGRRQAWREALLGLALIPAAFVLIVLLLAVLLALKPELHNVTVNPFERMLQTSRDAAIFVFVAMFAGGVREEIQRGFIIRRFDQYLGGGLFGVVIYGAVFGLGHIDQGYAAAIAIGVLGAAWGCLYWVRQSVVAPMVCHAGFNLAQLLKYVALQ